MERRRERARAEAGSQGTPPSPPSKFERTRPSRANGRKLESDHSSRRQGSRDIQPLHSRLLFLSGEGLSIERHPPVLLLSLRESSFQSLRRDATSKKGQPEIAREVGLPSYSDERATGQSKCLAVAKKLCYMLALRLEPQAELRNRRRSSRPSCAATDIVTPSPRPSHSTPPHQTHRTPCPCHPCHNTHKLISATSAKHSERDSPQQFSHPFRQDGFSILSDHVPERHLDTFLFVEPDGRVVDEGDLVERDYSKGGRDISEKWGGREGRLYALLSWTQILVTPRAVSVVIWIGPR